MLCDCLWECQHVVDCLWECQHAHNVFIFMLHIPSPFLEQYLGFVESSLFVAPYDALETSIFMTELGL